MFLPLSDAPNPKGVAYMTVGIIELNVLVFVFVDIPLGSQPAAARRRKVGRAGVVRARRCS